MQKKKYSMNKRHLFSEYLSTALARTFIKLLLPVIFVCSFNILSLDGRIYIKILQLHILRKGIRPKEVINWLLGLSPPCGPVADWWTPTLASLCWEIFRVNPTVRFFRAARTSPATHLCICEIKNYVSNVTCE